MQILTEVNETENAGHSDPISISKCSIHSEIWNLMQILTEVNETDNVGHSDPISISMYSQTCHSGHLFIADTCP